MECQRKSPPKDYGQGKLQGNSISNIYEVTAFIDNYSSAPLNRQKFNENYLF